jgi:hypothetical protein
MARRYGKPIHVWVQDGLPTQFSLNNVVSPIAAVLSSWHKRDHWWAPAPTIHVPAENDRYYYRVRCLDQRVFDLYFDSIASLWVLDTEQD